MKTLKESWESFEAAVIPKNMPDPVRRAMWQAFYAGALSFRSLLSDCPDDDAAIEQFQNQTDAELQTFFMENIRRGTVQ